MIYELNSQLTKAKSWKKERWRHFRYITHIKVLHLTHC